MNKKEIKMIVIVMIMLIFLYFFLKYITTKKVIEEPFLQDYSVNQYIPVYVSEDKMAKIYLDDYLRIMSSDPEKAYNLLDSNYRNKKFGNLDNFKTYISTLSFDSISIDRYLITSEYGYEIFKIYDNNNNLYIFKTKGVMQYSVYLDDTTIEI